MQYYTIIYSLGNTGYNRYDQKYTTVKNYYVLEKENLREKKTEKKILKGKETPINCTSPPS